MIELHYDSEFRKEYFERIRTSTKFKEYKKKEVEFVKPIGKWANRLKEIHKIKEGEK